jgi:branched-chain amino acid transport system substrate-binding protein
MRLVIIRPSVRHRPTEAHCALEWSAAVSAAARGQQEGLTNPPGTLHGEAAEGGTPAFRFMGRCARTKLSALRAAGLALGLAFGGLASQLMAAEGARASAPENRERPEDTDLETLRQRIDVGYYAVPDLPLKTNQNYAFSSSDVEPFGGVKPFKEHFLVQMESTGAGRGIPEPDQLDSVKIGFLGPIVQTVSVATGGASHEETLGIPMLRACRLAIEEANARGGYLKRKIPFELCVRNDNALWGASGSEVIHLAYKDNVWAIVGGVDGANTHIAIRVALKIEIPWMTPGDLDPTYIETNIPWVFRCIGDDRQQNYLLLDYLFRKMNCQRVAIIRSSNRYGRFGVREIRDGARRLNRPIVIEMAYRAGSTNFDLQLDRIQEYKPDAIVHWGDGADGAGVLNAIRARGWTQPFLTCDRAVSEEFLKIAGKNAEGVICGYPWDPDRKDPNFLAFKEAFKKRWGIEPDTYAAHAYDGINMLIWAIQTAGLNRARIRDVLAYRPEPFPGVTGDIPLSSALDDAGEVFLAIREQDKWAYHSREDLGISRGKVIEQMRVDREPASVKSEIRKPE